MFEGMAFAARLEPGLAIFEAVAHDTHILQELLLCLSHIEVLAHVCRDGLQRVNIDYLAASCKAVDAAAVSEHGNSAMCHLQNGTEFQAATHSSRSFMRTGTRNVRQER